MKNDIPLDVLYRNVKIYRPKEVTKILGVCFKTLCRYDKQGILKARRTATNRRYYLKSDIEDFINRSV